MTARREEIEAAVVADDTANPLAPLPRSAARLLVAMFATSDVCQRKLDALASHGFSRRNLPGSLLSLIRAGFLSHQQDAIDTYQLHLPVRR
jgi:hypothetical protein